MYVGSYTSEASADREADKYFDLGYNAFIEETQTRDGKPVYRLNVGDFTSEDFARITSYNVCYTKLLRVSKQ